MKWFLSWGTSWLTAVAVLAGEPSAKTKVLIVDGQHNHNWKTTTAVLRESLSTCGRFALDVATSPPTGGDMSRFRPRFDSYDAVLLNYNGDLWPGETRVALVQFVRKGGGLVVVHGANNAFPEWKEFNELIGLGGWGGRDERAGPYLFFHEGRVVRDPSPGRGGAHGPQYAFPVVVRNRDHPITRGMPETWLHVQDELYDRLRGPGKRLTVLATAWSDRGMRGSGRHEPVLFTVAFGRGRVFHTPLGHARYSLRCVGLVTALQRGTEWAATGKVTIPIPGDFPTARQTRARGEASVDSQQRPPLPAGPPLPAPPSRPDDPFAGKRPGQERDSGVGMKLCWCPSGSFQMGSARQEEVFQGDEQPVVVSLHGFWLSKCEVTRNVWRKVIDTQPWSEASSDASSRGSSGALLPATNVDWKSVVEFCLRLTRREHRAGTLPAGWQYRLPTEAQWEYAGRAGSQARFCYGARESQLGRYAWFAGNTVDRGEHHAHEVGRKQPNAWGFCDMHGNVWEWCRDWYDVRLQAGVDPELTKLKSVEMRAYRGGCWTNIAWYCRTADRNAMPPHLKNQALGFRVAVVWTGEDR